MVRSYKQEDSTYRYSMELVRDEYNRQKAARVEERHKDATESKIPVASLLERK